MSFYSLSEQIVTGMMLVGLMAVGAGICIVIASDKAQRWLVGERTMPKAQRDRIAMWRLRMIAEGRMDARTSCVVIPSEADLLASEAAFLHEVEQTKRQIAARKEREELVSAAEKQDTEVASASPPGSSQPPELSSPRTPQQTPVAAPPRVVIELVADPKFKVNLGTVSDEFREVVSDHREVLRGLVHSGDFDKVIDHFRHEEQRTHRSLRCASFVMNALFDSLKGVQIVGQLVGKITPESDERILSRQARFAPQRQHNAVYRNTFFMQLPSGRRPLQASDLISLTTKSRANASVRRNGRRGSL